MKLNNIQFTVPSRSPWQGWLLFQLTCAVFPSLWACHACPCSFTSLFHYTFTVLFKQSPKMYHQYQPMTNLQSSHKATLLCTPVSTLTWPVKTEPSFVKAKWAQCHSEHFSRHFGEVAAHEKATEFSSVCHFCICSKRDKLNVTCKNKTVFGRNCWQAEIKASDVSAR